MAIRPVPTAFSSRECSSYVWVLNVSPSCSAVAPSSAWDDILKKADEAVRKVEERRCQMVGQTTTVYNDPWVTPYKRLSLIPQNAF